jgi:thioesterase domain-containing protein
VRHYVAALGDNQPVFGVLGPEQIGTPPGYAGNLAELAAQRVRAIRSEQPSGPYFLAGYSLGGLLAYEVAGQLRAEGQQVAWVCLLNTATPEALARFWRRRYLRIGQVAMRVSPLTAWRTVRDEVRATRVFEGLRRVRLVDGFDPHAAIQLSLDYRCVGHDAPLDVFATSDELATIRSASLGWDQVHHGSITHHTVPGDHRSLVRASKEVQVASEMVATALRAAQAAL